MNQSNYITEINTLIDKYLHHSDFMDDEYINGQYTLVSAALRNYLPAIDPDTHETIFKKLLLHRKLSLVDQSSEEALENLTIEDLADDTLDILKSKPAIICTFHTGSYRLLNLLLAKKEIEFTLVIGKQIIKEEGSNFMSRYTDQTHGGILDIIDAEEARLGVRMLRKLKNGKTLLLYIDGNSGAQIDESKSDNRCIIDFLEQRLNVRKGIAYLAHAANVPIIPVACYRKQWHDIRMKFYPVIHPVTDIGRGIFASGATQQLYDCAASLIRDFPEQWEGWLYIHKYINLSHQIIPETYTGEIMVDRNVRFNISAFGVFKIGGQPFLFDKFSYSSFPISSELFSYLRANISKLINPRQMDIEVFTQLITKKVLVYL